MLNLLLRETIYLKYYNLINTLMLFIFYCLFENFNKIYKSII